MFQFLFHSTFSLIQDSSQNIKNPKWNVWTFERSKKILNSLLEAINVSSERFKRCNNKIAHISCGFVFFKSELSGGLLSSLCSRKPQILQTFNYHVIQFFMKRPHKDFFFWFHECSWFSGQLNIHFIQNETQRNPMSRFYEAKHFSCRNSIRNPKIFNHTNYRDFV